MKSIQFARQAPPPEPTQPTPRRPRYGGGVLLYMLVIVACVVTPSIVKRHLTASHSAPRPPFVWTHCTDHPGRIAVEVDNANYVGRAITVTVHAGTTTVTGEPDQDGWTVVELPPTTAHSVTVDATIDGQPRPTAHVDLPGPDCGITTTS